MARKLPPVNTRFKKGQSGNPEGARAHNKDLKKIRNLTNEEFKEVASVILNKDCSLEDLKQMVVTEEKIPPLTRWIASVVGNGIKKGDSGALNVLLDRICGKVKEHVHHTGTQTVMQQGTVLILPEKDIHIENNATSRPANKIPEDNG